jgi:hypothetical protein
LNEFMGITGSNVTGLTLAAARNSIDHVKKFGAAFFGVFVPGRCLVPRERPTKTMSRKCGHSTATERQSGSGQSLMPFCLILRQSPM